MTLSLAAPARAYRPFETTDASVSYLWQLTIEAAPASFLYNTLGDTSSLAPTLVLSFGLPLNFELGAGSRLLISLPDADGERTASFVTNTLTLKKIFIEGSMQDLKRRRISLGAEMNLLLPSTNTSEQVGFEAVLTMSHVWPDVLCFHLNAAGGIARAGGAGSFFAGLALEGGWSWPMRPVLELSWRYVDGQGSIPTVLGGMIMPLNIDTWFDVAARWARNPAGDSVVEITAGINWALPATPQSP
ncbi:MAG: hypothetical protein KC503_22450 [Myxococcales bacterium]|nr:hypothetical protein [Myxococcales bacterium]